MTALLILTLLSQWGWWGPGINADLLQGKDTTALWNAKTLQGRDTTTFVRKGTDSTLPMRGDGIAARPVGVFVEFEFLSTDAATPAPWFWAALSSGTKTNGAGGSAHPGVGRFSSSASSNSGFMMVTVTNALLLAGGEVADFVFRPESLIGTTIRVGFHDATSVTAPTDGAYLRIVDTLVRGMTMSNSTGDSTASQLRIVANRWYWAHLDVVSASKFVCTVVDSVGTQVWKDSVLTQIPTGAGRQCGHGFEATNSGTTAYPLVDVDYMNLRIARKISAGRPN